MTPRQWAELVVTGYVGDPGAQTGFLVAALERAIAGALAEDRAARVVAAVPTVTMVSDAEVAMIQGEHPHMPAPCVICALCAALRQARDERDDRFLGHADPP